MASCFDDTSNTSGAVEPKRLTSIGCPDPTSCDCVELVGGTRQVTSGTSVNLAIPLGADAEFVPSFTPSWSAATIVGTDLVITGDAPSGVHTLVYDISNECSSVCIIIDLEVSEPCTTPSNITQDISYVAGEFAVDSSIKIPANSTIISSNAGALDSTVYGSSLALEGNLTYPYPTTYSVTLSTECGNYTVSGNITQCQPPVTAQVLGSSVLERGVSGSMSWVVDATGYLTKLSQTGIPAGMSVSVAQNTPTTGKATVTVSGAPTDNPCTNGNCTIEIKVKNDCGELTLQRKYTQQPCRNIKTVGDSGSKVWQYDVPQSYCKIVEGYTPIELVNFEGVPYGMDVTLTAGPAANQYTVCVSGTPVADPCKDSATNICECVKVQLKNECGEKEIELCYTLEGSVQKPKFCLIQYKVSASPTSPNDVVIEFFGGPGGTDVTLDGVENAPVVITLDGDGYGTATITQLPAPTSGSPVCLTATHATCSFMVASYTTQISCQYPPEAPIPPGGA